MMTFKKIFTKPSYFTSRRQTIDQKNDQKVSIILLGIMARQCTLESHNQESSYLLVFWNFKLTQITESSFINFIDWQMCRTNNFFKLTKLLKFSSSLYCSIKFLTFLFLKLKPIYLCIYILSNFILFFCGKKLQFSLYFLSE